MDTEVTQIERGGWRICVFLRWAESAECFGGYTEVYKGDHYQFRVVLSGHFVDRAAAERALVERSDFWIDQWRAVWP